MKGADGVEYEDAGYCLFIRIEMWEQKRRGMYLRSCRLEG